MAATSDKTLQVELRTPEGSVFSGAAVKVQRLPASKGSMGVLSRHAPLMSSMDVGLTQLLDRAGTSWSFVTGQGFVEVLDDHVLMLVDTAEDITKIDIGRAEAAAERARQRLASGSMEDVDAARAEGSLERASMRLRFARRS